MISKGAGQFQKCLVRAWLMFSVANFEAWSSIYVERSGSGVELRTLDYENPGSNPGCGVKTLGKFFSLYIAPVHSAE